MIDIGTNYLNYTSSAYSAYKTNETSLVQKGQEISAANTQAETSSNNDINDEAIISNDAITLYQAEKAKEQTQTQDTTEIQAGTAQTPETTALPAEKKVQDNSAQDGSTNSDTAIKSQDDLTQEQQEEVSKLKARDTEVKTHEQAHMAAAAGLSVSAPTYTYQTGPDGQKYAIGGEVSVSFNKSNDPEENIQNAQTMKSAALAPADPSSQDRAAAQNADKIIAEAKEQERAQEQSKKEEESKTENSDEKTSQSTDTAPVESKNKSATVIKKQETPQTDVMPNTKTTDTASVGISENTDATLKSDVSTAQILVGAG